jgi:hypothetical protein
MVTTCFDLHKRPKVLSCDLLDVFVTCQYCHMIVMIHGIEIKNWIYWSLITLTNNYMFDKCQYIILGWSQYQQLHSVFCHYQLCLHRHIARFQALIVGTPVPNAGILYIILLQASKKTLP